MWLWAIALLSLPPIAYPAAAALVHGLDPSFWPDGTARPADWIALWRDLRLDLVFEIYLQMLRNRSAAFADGFWSLTALIGPLAVMIGWRLAVLRIAPQRDASDVFGGARFAAAAERARMNRGLELGIDPESGRPVRVAVQGTLATVAPPRKGKTSGALIPNLAYPEPEAWAGPAVIVDPKGELHRITAERRRALGRKVVCLDPLDLVGGRDRWNPLAGRDADDILYLQRSAGALLPEPTGGETAAYFRNRAISLVTGALLVTLRRGDRTLGQVGALIDSPDTFAQLEQLGENRAARQALEVLQADTKTRDPILSTAVQATAWLTDRRMKDLVGGSTFDLSDLSGGRVDLFVAVPPEYKEQLAPFLRLLLSDLFLSIRRNRPAERLLVMVHEAAALGRFSEILDAANELPGYGASLWTLWQARSQVVDLYGEAGADTILNTAEFVTLFGQPAVDPEESERWSRALGNYTAAIESLSRPAEGRGPRTLSRTPQAARLMPPETLASLRGDELLVFPNSDRYARHPMRLRKTVAHTDPRFARLIRATPPVGASS